MAKGAWVSHLVLAETMWVLDSVYARTPGQLAAVGLHDEVVSTALHVNAFGSGPVGQAMPGYDPLVQAFTGRAPGLKGISLCS